MGSRGHLFNLYHNSFNRILKKIIALYIQNIFEQNRCRSQLFKPLPKVKDICEPVIYCIFVVSIIDLFLRITYLSISIEVCSFKHNRTTISIYYLL